MTDPGRSLRSTPTPRPPGGGAGRCAVPSVLLGALVCVCGWATSSPAQTEPMPTASAETAAVRGLPALPTEVRYLPNAKGELVPVLRDANLEGYLDWLRQQQTRDPGERPIFSFSAVELEGTGDDDLATLKAVLRIQVSGSERPVLIPIGLGEAVITQATTRGPGRMIFGGKDRDQGYTWWFEGAGTYVLELNLLAPVRKAAPWRRLPLSVPLSPVTSLKLKLPLPNALVRTTDDSVIESTPLADGGTEVLVAGFGSRLELSWQPAISETDQPASLDVNTSIQVRGTTAAFLIEATQYVKALQGTFREFTVRLPPQSELMQVDGAEVRETRRDPRNPDRITVQLNGPTAGPVSVRWQVRMLTAERRRTVLEGFQVESARRQSGDIGLLAPESARWTFTEGSDPQLERMNAGELRNAAAQGQIVRAYRFYGQPFRLPLVLEPVEPYYDARPLLVVYASEDDIRLDARYDVRTFRGQLSELALLWPGWRTEGWVLEGVQPQGTVVSGFSTGDDDADGRVVIRISDRATEAFQVRLTGRYLRRTPDEARLSLPRLENPTRVPPRVLFVHAENVDADLTARNETALRPVTGEPAPSSEELGYPPDLQVRQYRLESDERAVSIRVTPRPLQVSVDRRVQVSFTPRRLTIRQELIHEIAYDRLGDLLIGTPADLATSVRFRLGTLDLIPEWQPGDSPRERLARLRLPDRQLGRVVLSATWDQPLPDELWNDRDATVGIPLLTSRRGQIESTRVEFTRPAWFDVSAVGTEWDLEHLDDEVSRWQTNSPAGEFTAVIAAASGADGEPLLATRAQVRVQLERTGVQHYQYQVQLQGDVPRVNVQLPRGAAGVRFFWGRQPVPEREALEMPADSRRYTVPVPELSGLSSERSLAIEYTLPGGVAPALTSVLSTRTPQLPQCRWAAQIVWQVFVPGDQHLFAYPTSAAPLFEWVRDGLLYRRVSPPLNGELPSLEPTNTLPGVRHRYAFSQFGGVQELELRLLSSGAALFCGAGFSLLLGFAMLKATWLRSLPALLLLCAGILATTLWLLPQIELLLQPMLLGAFLAVMLGLLDAWNRRRLAGTVLTLSATPSEFQPAESSDSGSGPQGLLIGHPDSATVFRPQPAGEGSRPRIPAESQVG
jgi:hypothetical protein